MVLVGAVAPANTLSGTHQVFLESERGQLGFLPSRAFQ